VLTAEAKPGPFSRAFQAAFPGFAARRAEARLRHDRAEAGRDLLRVIHGSAHAEFARGGYGYLGASKERPYSKWNPQGGSPDEDLLQDLDTLRQRSRDLIRSDPHASGLVDVWCRNIVGAGLRPQSRLDRDALGLTEAQADEWQRACEKAFQRFWKRADVSGLQNFGEVQALILRQVFENGESFVLPRPDPGRKPFSLRLQVIEGDRVSTPSDKINDLRIRDGVVVGELGERLGYWIKKTHPGDVSQGEGARRTNDFVFVPAEDLEAGVTNCFHLYRILRPDQSRGAPFLSTALTVYKDLGQYIRAELISAKIAACYALFITAPDPLQAAAANAELNAKKQNQRQIEPGMMEYLAPGQDIKEANPNRPNNAFDAFVRRLLRSAGAALNTPYELVSQDFSQTTYTSGRMSLNEVRGVFRLFQAWLAEKFCQPIWERALREAFLLGMLPMRRDFEENFEEYARARWVGPGWTWVDPAKEVAATRDALDGNLSTLADECAARGLDWEDVLRQRAREKRLMEELGVLPAAAVPGGDGPPQPREEADGEEAPDGEEKRQSA